MSRHAPAPTNRLAQESSSYPLPLQHAHNPVDWYLWGLEALAGAAATSTLPLLRERPATNCQTTLYVCFNRTCQLPVHTVAEALAQL
jgi:uncharacterized protein YyaL (SSP411 family)